MDMERIAGPIAFMITFYYGNQWWEKRKAKKLEDAIKKEREKREGQ